MSILFAASLGLGGLAELLTMRAGFNLGHWILLGSLMVQVVAAVVVMVQNYQGVLRPAMRNLAITFLASIGLWFYVVQMATGAAIGYQNARSRVKVSVRTQDYEPLTMIAHPTARGFSGGIALLLGLAGAVLLLREEQAPEDKVSFNV